ncbi:MAG: hypothetical protein NPIRA01_10280 [Nitrospirales bacterium]|nr:MAG: hypothetical protein NPIRA01_10280 [Nitrospirales bacterium]
MLIMERKDFPLYTYFIGVLEEGLKIGLIQKMLDWGNEARLKYFLNLRTHMRHQKRAERAGEDGADDDTKNTEGDRLQDSTLKRLNCRYAGSYRKSTV